MVIIIMKYEDFVPKKKYQYKHPKLGISKLSRGICIGYNTAGEAVLESSLGLYFVPKYPENWIEEVEPEEIWVVICNISFSDGPKRIVKNFFSKNRYKEALEFTKECKNNPNYSDIKLVKMKEVENE